MQTLKLSQARITGILIRMTFGLLGLWVCLLAIGCNQASAPGAPVSEAATDVPRLTSTRPPQPSSTATQVPPTRMPTAPPIITEFPSQTSKADPSQNYPVEQACPELIVYDMESFPFPGWDALMWNDFDFYIHKPESNSKIDLGQRYLGTAQNGLYLALSDAETLVILDTEGNQLASVPQLPEKITFSGWFDDQRVLFDNPGQPLSSTLVINPFTSEQWLFESNYPDIETINFPQFHWGDASNTLAVYSPDLSMVLYPHTDGGTYVVWSLAEQRSLAQFEFFTNFFHSPIWFPDGQAFLLANPRRDTLLESRSDWPNDEFYRVQIDGEVVRLTNLDDLHGETVNIYFYQLSPDGRKVAFWLARNWEERRSGNLAVLEMDTQRISEYCYQGIFFPPVGGHPFWSANSQYVDFRGLIDGQEWSLTLDTVNLKMYGTREVVMRLLGPAGE